MKHFLVILTLLQWAASTSISPITAKGSKLFSQDGTQFFAKGVAYGGAADATKDRLADTEQCNTDAKLMKALGANTINVYYVDALQDHDGCMQTFADQGIYVWLQLSSDVAYFDCTDPSWSMALFNHFSTVIDLFAKYDNILAFSVGSSRISDANSTICAPYIKAAARDMKAYRTAKGYRQTPIGYSAWDMAGITLIQGDYFLCGDQQDALEIYGINIYSWCGNSSYHTSSREQIYTNFKNYNVPVLFTETGCNAENKDFSEVGTMLGPVFRDAFSGAIVYEWTQDAQSYGLVSYSNTENTGSPSTMPAFNALSTIFAETNPTGVLEASYTLSNNAPSCPTSGSSWSVDPSGTLPVIAGLNLATISAVTTYTTSTTPTSASTNSTATGSSSSSTDESSTGMSTGTKAGIAIGVVLGLLLLGAVLFFWKRRRVNVADYQPTATQDPEQVDQSSTYKSELPASSAMKIVPKSELDSSPGFSRFWRSRNAGNAELESHNQATYAELESQDGVKRTELDAGNGTAELEHLNNPDAKADSQSTAGTEILPQYSRNGQTLSPVELEAPR